MKVANNNIGDAQSLPKGYKQTEVGVIPEDWKVEKIESVCKVVGGGTPSTTIPKYWNGAVNWFTPTEIGGLKYVSKSRRKISEEGLKNSSAQILPIGSILMTTRATIGDLAITTLPATTNQGFQSLVPINIEKNYLYYLMQTKHKELIENASGSTFLEISPRKVKNIFIQLPSSKEEQKAIATALSDVDALISSLDQLISKKKAIKQGAMQELLTPPVEGGKRLPGFSGNWEERRLGEVADFYKGKGLPKLDIVEGGKYKCIHYGELFTKYNQIIKSIKSRTNQNNEVFQSKKNDVLMPTSDVTPNGLATASAIFQDDVFLGGDILVIRPNKNVFGAFLSYQVSINREQILSLISGTTVYHLYGSDMAKFKFSIPEINEQKAIIKILSDMDEEIEALEAKKSKYQQIKQGMMQELLTGKIRLV